MHDQFVKYGAILLVLSGCSFNNHLESVPSTGADFALPPSELVKKFSDIRRFDEQHGGIGLVPLEELESAWGKPDRIEPTNKTEHTAGKVHFASDLLLLTGGSAIASGIVIGMVMLPASPPPEKYIWTKKRYTITSTVSGGSSNKQLGYWNWEYQGNKETRPVIEHKPIPTWFYSIIFSRGTAGFSNKIDIDDLGSGFGLQFNVGRLLKTPIKNTHLQLAVSLKLGGNTEKKSQDGSRQIRTTSYMLEAAPIYRWPNSKWMAGAGLTYYTASKIRFNFREDESLNDSFGAVGIVEYAYNKRFTLGSRLDLINQKTPSGLEYNGSSFGLYTKGYFY